MTIRVLHVIESLGRGGAERQLVNLALSHSSQDVISKVVTTREPLHLAPALRAAGIAVSTLSVRGAADLPFAARRLYAEIASFRPDVLHTWLFEAGVLGRSVATLFPGVRVVSAVQAPNYDPDSLLGAGDYRAWKLQVVRAVDMLTGYVSGAHFVACGDFVGRSTRRALHLPRSRMHMIPNATFIPDAPPRLVSLQPLTPDDEINLLMVARLAPQKGHSVLLAAVPSLLERYSRLRLDLVGTGPLEDSLREQVERLGIAGAVRFLGPQDDVPARLTNAHVFVAPSLYEGLSLVVLEALALGIPSVASDIPAMRDISPNGEELRFAAPRSPEALAAAIHAVLSDLPLRRSMSAAARRRVASEFSVQASAERHRDLYRSLLTGSRPDPQSDEG